MFSFLVDLFFSELNHEKNNPGFVTRSSTNVSVLPSSAMAKDCKPGTLMSVSFAMIDSQGVLWPFAFDLFSFTFQGCLS